MLFAHGGSIGASMLRNDVRVPADSLKRDTAVYRMAPVTVISSISRMDPVHAPFSLAVIRAEDIQAQPIRAVSDVLAYVHGVDLTCPRLLVHL